jgi:hypothetical protein
VHVVHFTMTRPRDAPVPAEGAVTGALRAVARLHQGPEHIRVHGSRAGARGVMFVIAPNPETARAVCLIVCIQAIARTPELAGWFVHV